MAHILIAEDERDIRDLIKFTLTYAGHDVTAATNGEEAVQLAPSAQPDLIMLDLRMPKLNGFDACRRLKNNEQTRNIPVVFLSAKGMDDERSEAERAGGIGFITKPFSPDGLAQEIETILKQVKFTKP